MIYVKEEKQKLNLEVSHDGLNYHQMSDFNSEEFESIEKTILLIHSRYQNIIPEKEYLKNQTEEKFHFRIIIREITKRDNQLFKQAVVVFKTLTPKEKKLLCLPA